MGAAYFIVLERNIEGFDPFVNGKAIAKDSDLLDEIAGGLGLRAIGDFVSQDPAALMAMAEEFEFELPQELPAVVWFAADDGLDWVCQVEKHVRENPRAVRYAEAVLYDLMEYRTVLDAAKSNGVRWHMEVDF